MTEKSKPPRIRSEKFDDKGQQKAFLDIPIKGAGQLRKKLGWETVFWV
jgi:hypothetical protein